MAVLVLTEEDAGVVLARVVSTDVVSLGGVSGTGVVEDEVSGLEVAGGWVLDELHDDANARDAMVTPPRIILVSLRNSRLEIAPGSSFRSLDIFNPPQSFHLKSRNRAAFLLFPIVPQSLMSLITSYSYFSLAIRRLT